MEENLHNKDNFESFFKNSFDDKNESPSPNEWATPSDAVWEEIAEGLPPTTAPKVGYSLSPRIKWAAAMLLFLLGGATIFLYFQNRNLTQIIHQYNEMAEKVPSSQIQKTTAPSGKTNPNPSLNQVTPPENNTAPYQNNLQRKEYLKSESNLASKISDSRPEVNTPSPLTKKRKKTDNRINEDEPYAENPVNNPTDESIQQNNVTDLSDKIEPLVLVQPIPSIDPTFGYQEDISILSSFHPSVPTQKTSKSSSKLFLGAYISPSYSGKTVSPRFNNTPPPFKEQEKSKITTNWGIKLGFRLTNRWDLLTGISKTNSTQTQKRHHTFQHESANEQQVDNEYVTTYGLSVSSSYGTSDAAVEIARPNNAPLNDRILPLSITLQQKISFISVPLLLRHNTKIGRFNLSLTGGFALNVLDKFESTLTASSLRPNFRTKPPQLLQSPKIKNNTSLDFVAGIGLTYDITPKFSLFVEPQVQKNLKPFVKNEEFQSSIYIAGIQLGGYWNF